MSSALVPFLALALAYCLTVVCCTAIALVVVTLRGTSPAQRSAILRSLAHVVRAWAEALRFWRRR